MADPWIIDVPNVGEVEFPATMTEADVTAAVKRLHDEHPMTKASTGMMAPSTADDDVIGGQKVPSGVVGQVFLGAGDRVKEIGTGLAALPGAVMDDPAGVAMGILPGMWEGIKDTASDAVSMDPRRMGGAAVDLATMLPMIGPAARTGKAATMAAGRGVATAAEAATATPLRAGVTGALVGTMTGHGPVAGATAAMLGQGQVGRGAAAIRKLMTPATPPVPRTGVPGARVVAGSPRPTMSDSLTQALNELRAEGVIDDGVSVGASAPTGGGYTVPPTAPSVNAGGALTRRTPQTSMMDSLRTQLDEMRQPPATQVELAPSHPVGGGFTTPPDRPLVNFSPDAQTALDKLMKKGAKEPKVAAAADSSEALYRQLSSKAVLTPEETQILAQLEAVLGKRASAKGLSYASGGR